jgi:hypothetical protein
MSGYQTNCPITQRPLLWKQILSVDVRRLNLEIHVIAVGQFQSQKVKLHKTRTYSHHFPTHVGDNQRIMYLKRTWLMAIRSEC